MKFGSLFSGIGGFETNTKNLQPHPLVLTNAYTYKAPCSEEELWDMYVNQCMTQTEIADKIGTTQRVIWRAMKKMGIKARVAAKRDQKGSKNSYWKGGRVLMAKKARKAPYDGGGYWYVLDPYHPHANKNGYVAEHVKVALEKYGRNCTEKGESVHHIDFTKRNNDPENLVIIDQKRHAIFHGQIHSIVAELWRRGVITFDENDGYTLCA